jgi:type II secretory pathway component GspD/PulD (secretin)
MRLGAIILVTFALSFASAEEKIKMYFNNEDLTKIIEMYSKASGQKFIVDPGVRGRISIFLQEPVTLLEAFNQVSSALAINGYAISKQGDTMVIKSARNIQRDLIEVSTEVPSLKPERMYTWIYTAKNVPATQINRDLRILPSRDGEMNINERTNQIIITDWASNLNRVAVVLKEIDIQPSAATAKMVAQERKARQEHGALKLKEAASKTDEKSVKAEKQ